MEEGAERSGKEEEREWEGVGRDAPSTVGVFDQGGRRSIQVLALGPGAGRDRGGWHPGLNA